MSKKMKGVRDTLYKCIEELSKNAWMFTKNPEKDFTRNRKLSFDEVIKILLGMEGRSLSNELLSHFHCDACSASAFVQQRAKLNEAALPTLFHYFIEKTDRDLRHKGYRLLAADGSDFQIASNPNHPDSHFPGTNGQRPYNLLHLDALYDLLSHTYVDASVCGQRKAHETAALCSMVDHSTIKNAIVIADRGYESYNLMAHVQEKGWNFVLRAKDISSSGMLAGYKLPDQPQFDISFDVAFTRRQTEAVKELLKDKNHYKFLPANARLDYLPLQNKKHDPVVFYTIHFRVVRFQLSENNYECLITNLQGDEFSIDDLKQLYALRWGIETSFRELKHIQGLLHFHSKKVEYIYQELFARLIMYNFTQLITSHITIQVSGRKYEYRPNFSAAVQICRQFFRGDVSPPLVEAAVRRNISPIRPGRNFSRNKSISGAVGFNYRLA